MDRSARVLKRCPPTLILALALVSSSARADGGAPLLLFINVPVFVIGFVWIILAEFVVYRRLIPTLAAKDALYDVAIVNLASTLAIGIGIPICLALVGLLGGLLPGTFGGILAAAGTWLGNYSQARWAFLFTALWVPVSFVATVYFEAWCFKQRWKRRPFMRTDANQVSWKLNAVSYTGLVVIGVLMWLVFRS